MSTFLGITIGIITTCVITTGYSATFKTSGLVFAKLAGSL
jgi:hypothetical protein